MLQLCHLKYVISVHGVLRLPSIGLRSNELFVVYALRENWEMYTTVNSLIIEMNTSISLSEAFPEQLCDG